MTAHLWVRRILILAIGAVVLLMVAEVGFRVAARFRHRAETPAIPAQFAGVTPDNQYTVVVIGESTTAKSVINGVDTSWPTALVAKLNLKLEARGSKARVDVINIGHAGVPTAFLIKSFEELLARKVPDVVISMMGINDARMLSDESGFWYRSSYVVRFLYWASVAWGCPACYQVDEKSDESFRKLNPNELAAIKQIDEFIRSRKLKTLDDLKALKLKTDEIRAAYANDQFPMNIHVGWRLFTETEAASSKSPEFVQFGREEIKRLLEESSDYALTENSALILTCYLVRRFDGKCLPVAREAFEKGLVPTSTLLTLIVNEGSGEDPSIKRILRARGFELVESRGPLEGVRQSYMKLGKITRDYGIIWFAMQYPTGAVDGLEWFLAKNPSSDVSKFIDVFYGTKKVNVEKSERDLLFQDVMLIGNEEFAAFAAGPTPEKYFTDFFGRQVGANFGHTTLYGSELIAENVSEALLKNWSRIEARRQR